MEGWDLKGIRARCERFRAHVLQHGLATEAEMAPHWPGGAINPERDKGAWIYCYGSLRVLVARADPVQDQRRQAVADALLVDALNESPVTVPLQNPPAGAPAVLAVYPKGLTAMLEVQLLQSDRLPAYVMAAANALELQLPEAQSQAVEAIGYAYAMLVWIITHPGPGLPYSEGELDPQPPAWLRHLDPLDLFRVCQANDRANGATRLKALEAFTRPGDVRERPIWSIWLAGVAQERGESVYRLMRYQSMVGLVAQTALAAEAKRRAHEAGKRAVEEAAHGHAPR